MTFQLGIEQKIHGMWHFQFISVLNYNIYFEKHSIVSFRNSHFPFLHIPKMIPSHLSLELDSYPESSGHEIAATNNYRWKITKVLRIA